MFRLKWIQTVAAFTALSMAVLVAIILALLPNATNYQLFILRVVLSISAAALAYTVPGMVEVKFEGRQWQIIRFLTAIGMFALVYQFVKISGFPARSDIQEQSYVPSSGSHLVCIGEPLEFCEKNSVALQCNTSIVDWARNTCNSPYQIVSKKAASGGKCGFYYAEVACLK
jgi:hypothetical protein